MSVATELQTLLASAAATMTGPTLASVRGGEPDVVNVPTLAYWYTATKTWQSNSFAATQELSCWHVRLYVPASTRFTPADITLDDWVETCASAVRGQLYGHVGLGGAASGRGVSVSDATAGWAQVGGVLCRIVDMDVEAMQSAVHAIAQ